MNVVMKQWTKGTPVMPNQYKRFPRSNLKLGDYSDKDGKYKEPDLLIRAIRALPKKRSKK